MQSLDTSESVWARGRNDTWAVVFTSKKFWLLEAGGGAVTGAFYGWLAVFWLLGIFLAVWIGATASAPIRQRDEARAAIRDMSDADEVWCDMESAGRHYRDLLSDFGMIDGMKAFDAMSSPHPQQPTESPVGNAFRFVAQEGINCGILEVSGVPENGSRRVDLKNVKDDAVAYSKSMKGKSLVLVMDDVYYRDLLVKTSTIRPYVEHVREHDAKLLVAAKSTSEDQTPQPPPDTEEEKQP